MGPDDPGTATGAGARSSGRPAPNGLWSYDGGWQSPTTDADPRARRPRPPATDPDAGSGSGEDPGGAGGADRSDRWGGRSGAGERRRGRGSGGIGSRDDRPGRGRRGSGGRGGDGPAPEDAPGDPESVARAVCLRLLALQPRTRAELATALAKRGVPDEAAEAVLSRFTEVGLIDDRAFATAWVDSRHSGRGLARRALAAELRRRGVDGEVVGEAVAVVDNEAEERAARQLVARRIAATRRLDQPARIRRLAGMLARRGYPPGLSLRVVREALAAEGTDPGDLDLLDDTVPDDT